MILDRETLIEIREKAREAIALSDLNEEWIDAYRCLAVSADHLDAMIARAQVKGSANEPD